MYILTLVYDEEVGNYTARGNFNMGVMWAGGVFVLV